MISNWSIQICGLGQDKNSQSTGCSNYLKGKIAVLSFVLYIEEIALYQI